MATNRALLLLSCGVLLVVAPVHGEEKHLSDRARALTGALTELQQKPSDPLLQQRYLNAFPHDYKSFLQLFGPDRELYDGYDFISVLPSLAKELTPRREFFWWG